MKKHSNKLLQFKGTVVTVFLLLGFYLIQIGCDDDDSSKSKKVETEAVRSVADNDKIVPVLSGNVPTEIHFLYSDTMPVDNRPVADQFSWQTFIALFWPVIEGQRGIPLNPDDPNTFLNMTNSTPVVWTSYKNQWDLFGQGKQKPSSWNSWTNPVNICSSAGAVKHVFGSAKSEMLPGEANESLSVPLIDQAQNYVLYEIKYNAQQYNFIVDNGLYSNINLYKYQQSHGGAVSMPSSNKNTQGSILIKAAWKFITTKDDPSRYYIIDEIAYDPLTKQCSKQMLGLVGLHIAQKVDGFPQWIWSSFEHIDNVPGAPNGKSPYSFNNGTSTPSTTDHGFANKPNGDSLYADKKMRVPVQVNRLNEIPTTPAGLSTADINTIYQKALSKSWMQNYQLVITQWPTKPSQFKQYTQNGIYPTDCGAAFPVNNCVNSVLETYFQNRNDAAGAGGNSCMSCHYQAPNTDFSWSLQLRSH